MIPSPTKQETPSLNLSTYQIRTGRLVDIDAVVRFDEFRVVVVARVATDDGERLATFRVPVSALRGWRTFCRAALDNGLALDPAGSPSNWNRAVFDAAKRGEAVPR